MTYETDYGQVLQNMKAAQDKARVEQPIDEMAIRQQRKDEILQYMRSAGIGRRYAQCTFENFFGGEKYTEACRLWLSNPVDSLYLYGPCGCGKTHLASALVRGLLLRMRKVEFICAIDLLAGIRRTFSNNATQTETEIVNHYSHLDFFVLDDIGAEKASDWTRGVLYQIINRRDADLLPTIITSNLQPDELADKTDMRIASRISNGKIWKIDMPDYRRKR